MRENIDSNKTVQTALNKWAQENPELYRALLEFVEKALRES
jgi:hypothetical protein